MPSTYQQEVLQLLDALRAELGRRLVFSGQGLRQAHTSQESEADEGTLLEEASHLFSRHKVVAQWLSLVAKHACPTSN